VDSSVAVVDDMVFAASSDGYVYAINIATGSLTWRQYYGGFAQSSPAVHNGRVFVGNDYGEVYALDATTGVTIWKYTTSGMVRSPAAVSDGKVFIGSYDKKLYALDENSGALIWSYATGGIIASSSPAVADGKVYVGSDDGNIYCLNEVTGSLVWKYATGWAVRSSAAFADGKIFIRGASLFALDASSGILLWSHYIGGGGSDLVSSPAVAYSKVFVGSENYQVYALDETTGALAWTYSANYGVTSSPAVADSKVFVGSQDGKVYALNAATGTKIWNYTTGGSVVSSPAVVNGVVYVGSYDGKIYAFGPSPLVTVSISPTSVTMDVGQSQLFTSSVTGGTAPYTYQWYLNGAPVSGATKPTWTFTPTSAGSVTVYLTVTDSASAVATSNIVSVTVNGPLSITVAPSSATIGTGQSQLFTSTVSGGTSPFAYQWYLNGAAVPSATSSTWTFTPSSKGSYSIYANVTDNAGFTAKSNIATLSVTAVSVTISPTSVTLNVGQSQLFTSSVSGGASPYSYQWSLNGASVLGATSSSWAFPPPSAGSYTIYVKVSDAVGGQATSNTASAIVTVNGQISGSPSGGGIGRCRWL
jgi:outer membrane protein assembly factor BamB